MSADASPLTPSAAARALGHAGLLPFLGGAALLWWGPGGPFDAFAREPLWLLGYAAVIASFLGGIHWGLAMRDTRPHAGPLLWGVTPSLAAWAALLLPPATGLVLSAATLATCYAVDRRVYARAGLAGWLPLRRRLSSVAILCCLAGAVALGA